MSAFDALASRFQVKRLIFLLSIMALVIALDLSVKSWVSRNCATPDPPDTHAFIRVAERNYRNLSTFIQSELPYLKLSEARQAVNTAKAFGQGVILSSQPIEEGQVIVFQDVSYEVWPDVLRVRYRKNYGNALGFISAFEPAKRTHLEDGFLSRSERRLVINFGLLCLNLWLSYLFYRWTSGTRVEVDKRSDTLETKSIDTTDGASLSSKSSKEKNFHPTGASIRKPPGQMLATLGIGLFAGGGISHAIERAFKGFVVDYLELEWVMFPTFNLADMALSVGFVCLLMGSYRMSKSSEAGTVEHQ